MGRKTQERILCAIDFISRRKRSSVLAHIGFPGAAAAAAAAAGDSSSESHEVFNRLLLRPANSTRRRARGSRTRKGVAMRAILSNRRCNGALRMSLWRCTSDFPSGQRSQAARQGSGMGKAIMQLHKRENSQSVLTHTVCCLAGTRNTSLWHVCDCRLPATAVLLPAASRTELHNTPTPVLSKLVITLASAVPLSMLLQFPRLQQGKRDRSPAQNAASPLLVPRCCHPTTSSQRRTSWSKQYRSFYGT